MSNHEGESHGNTPAAWTAVILCILGFLVGGLGLPLHNVPMFIVGAVAVVISPIVGKVMQLMGMGAIAK
jgi:hypothetical protein